MKLIDFFAGIGGFRSGLEKAGMECIGWCEFDKFAQRSYRAMYNTERLWFAGDVRKVRGWDVPKADLWTFGFPCQDVSIAGKQKGIKRGTRSGLFYEIMRLLDEAKENKPDWLICENVKNLLSIDNGRGFFEVLSEMGKRGYTLEWRIYNSKDYGVPQGRERVYIVGYSGNTSGRPLLPIARNGSEAIEQIIGGRQAERVYNGKKISRIISSSNGGLGSKTGLYIFNGINEDGILDRDKIRIRRLTPRECFRLQGFTDEQYNKAAAVNSETQLYKQAGNAVTVNVVEEIGRHIKEVASRLN